MTDFKTATIVEWKPERSFGYVDYSGKRLFLHLRDFTERHHFPRAGDRVAFVVGKDAKGRWCAQQVRTVSTRSRLTIGNAVGLLFLLALPALAIMTQPFDVRFVSIYFVSISIMTWSVYGEDKRRAQSGSWRISEATLHTLDFLGGWPGGFLAQKQLRHKTSKGGFQLVFWATVSGYQFVAFDYLADWQWSRMFLQAIELLVA